MSKEDSLLQQIKSKKLPEHIAVIMDGNGRWAKKKGYPRVYGHNVGAKSVRVIVEACCELNLKALTLYAFSTENWNRPAAEVDALMKLLCMKLNSEADDLDRNGVQLRTIGRTDQLPQKVQKELNKTIQRLERNKGLVLNLALNYGGRQEIVDAVNLLIKQGVEKSG